MLVRDISRQIVPNAKLTERHDGVLDGALSLPALDAADGDLAELPENMDRDDNVFGMPLDINVRIPALDRDGGRLVHERIRHSLLSHSLSAFSDGLATSGCSASFIGESTKGNLQFWLNHSIAPVAPVAVDLAGEQAQFCRIAITSLQVATLGSLFEELNDEKFLRIGACERLNDNPHSQSDRSIHEISPPIPDTLL